MIRGVMTVFGKRFFFPAFLNVFAFCQRDPAVTVANRESVVSSFNKARAQSSFGAVFFCQLFCPQVPAVRLGQNRAAPRALEQKREGSKY